MLLQNFFFGRLPSVEVKMNDPGHFASAAQFCADVCRVLWGAQFSVCP